MAINDDANKAKPEGNTDDTAQSTPDVKHEGWSAEEVAEESGYQDGTAVKGEMKQGKKVERENERQ